MRNTKKVCDSLQKKFEAEYMALMLEGRNPDDVGNGYISFLICNGKFVLCYEAGFGNRFTGVVKARCWNYTVNEYTEYIYHSTSWSFYITPAARNWR